MSRLLALVASLTWSTAAAACDLALVLGIDVSHSIDNGEYAFQVAGTAEALSDPVIAEALVDQQALLTVVQWSGVGQQEVSIPWTRLATHGDVRALQQQMRTLRRPWEDSNTAVGEAIRFMANLLKDAPCARKVIDFSGDGMNNAGQMPVEPRGRAMAAGVVINGLAIDRIGLSVTNYFRRHVIAGRGSFVVTAKGYRDYPRAIRQKLFRELLPPSS